jgi:CubicO group peptidase (beta-lactamase class C family)
MDRWENTDRVIADGINTGLHSGAQIYISLQNQTVHHQAFGEARPGEPMELTHRLCWLSSGKPVTAVAILQLIECGRAELDERVSDFLPEFATHGKDTITLRHLLTHTGGFRTAEGASAAPSWNEIIRRLCQARLEKDWIPGRTAGYHYTSSWFILAEIVQRISGTSFQAYVSDHIFLPLEHSDVTVQMTEEEYVTLGDRIAPMFISEAGGLRPHPSLDSLGESLKCKPGSGFRGPVSALGHFYEMLLNDGMFHNRSILDPRSVSQMTRRQRHGLFDETFKHTLDWGLGVIINDPHGRGDDMPYGFGRYASAESFGHGGLQSSVGMADPRHRLVVACIFNGQPGEEKHQKRIRALFDAIYRDIGIVSSPHL